MHFSRFFLVVTAATLVFLAGCSRSLKVGSSFDSSAAFEKSVERRGYTIVGRMNESFPAEITSVSEGNVDVDVSIEKSDGDKSEINGVDIKAITFKREDGGVMAMFLARED